MQQEIPEPPVRLGVDGGVRGQLRVGLIVAGQQRERRAGARAGLDDLLDSIGPVGLPAEQAHDDEPGLRDDLLAIEIDRGVVRELHEVGETHGGKRLAERPARRRQRGELGVGGRQDDDVTRGLTEVDGLGAVGDDTRLGLEKVHWSVEREVAMRNDALSVTSRIVVSAPNSRLENSPLPTPQVGRQ